jgi:hypothetical protein
MGALVPWCIGVLIKTLYKSPCKSLCMSDYKSLNKDLWPGAWVHWRPYRSPYIRVLISDLL